jgi:hypothetical protein
MTRVTPHGFALLFTLVAIVLISALVAATMFRVTENNYLAQLTTLKLHTMAESERQLWATMSDPGLFAFAAAPIGMVKTSIQTTGDVTTVITITKVDAALLWLVASSSAQHGRLSAAHRTAVSAQLTVAGVRPAQPLPGPTWVDVY